MAVNKVIYNDETVMDISDSTVTPDTLADGETAYDASGAKIVGTNTKITKVSDDNHNMAYLSSLEAGFYYLPNTATLYYNGGTVNVYGLIESYGNGWIKCYFNNMEYKIEASTATGSNDGYIMSDYYSPTNVQWIGGTIGRVTLRGLLEELDAAEKIISVIGTETDPVLVSSMAEGVAYLMKGYVAYDTAHKSNVKALPSVNETYFVTIRKASSYVDVAGNFGTLTVINDGTFRTSYYVTPMDVSQRTGIDLYEDIVLADDVEYDISWCSGIYVSGSIKRLSSDTEPDSHYGGGCYLFPMSNPDTATTFNFLVIPGGYSNKADKPFLATYTPGNTVATTAETYPWDSVEFLTDFQKKPKAMTINLPSSGWTGSDMVYSQTITVSGVTANSQVDLRPSPTQLQELLTAEISLTAANDAGTVTVFAIGGKPSSDYSMQIIVSEVDVV